jgi:hypothetical protein
VVLSIGNIYNFVHKWREVQNLMFLPLLLAEKKARGFIFWTISVCGMESKGKAVPLHAMEALGEE